MRGKVASVGCALALVSVVVAGCGQTIEGIAQPGDQISTGTAARSGGPVPVSELAGAWTGTYICNQGETALDLRIERAVNGSARAVFAFGPTASNPSPRRGRKASSEGSSRCSISSRRRFAAPSSSSR